MGKIAFLRPVLRKAVNFRAVSEQTKTHYDSLLTERITSKSYPGISRGISAGWGNFALEWFRR